MKINKLFIGTDTDVMIGNTYIPPYKTRYESRTPYQDLQDELLKFKNNPICIAGDLNSHSGTNRDYVEIEDFNTEQLNFDSEAQNHLNNILWLKNNNINLSRSNVDHRKIDNHGTQLIEFCKTNNLFICNGRLNTDATGKATTKDGSLIDYMLASPLIITKIENFYVHDFDAIFSDKHCRVSWSIQCPRSIQTKNNNKGSNLITIKKTHRNMWASDKAVAFSEQLNINDIINIRGNLTNVDIEVNCILNKIQKLFENTANTVLGHEREYQIDANAIRKPIKFNRETLNIRNRYYKAKKQNDGTKEKRDEVADKSKAYKKAVLKAKALHRKQTIKKLRNAKTSNPKLYWSVLNRQFNNTCKSSIDAIPINDFLRDLRHFQELIATGIVLIT